MNRANKLTLFGLVVELFLCIGTGLNSNVLFLIFWGVSCLIFILLRPYSRCGPLWLLLLPAVIVGAPFAPKTVLTSIVSYAISIPREESWEYKFNRSEFAPYQKLCRFDEPDLVIQGEGLEGLRVIINGTEVKPNLIEPYSGYQRWRGKVSTAADLLLVSLEWRDKSLGNGPAIWIGPQFDNGRLFPEAVFLVADNRQCRLVLHSRRDCSGICPEILADFRREPV